jgi:hypothetical protein
MDVDMLTILYRNVNFHNLFLAHSTFQFPPQLKGIIISKLNFMLDLDHFNFNLIPNWLQKVILI